MSTDVSPSAPCGDSAAFKQRRATLKHLPRDTPHAAADVFPVCLDRVHDDAVLMRDPAGHVLTWRTSAARIKGYAADDIREKEER